MYLETDGSENTRQTLWEAAEAILAGKFTATANWTPPQKKKKLPYHQKKLEKNNKQPEVSRRKETIKIREKINKFFLNGKKIKSRTIWKVKQNQQISV